MAEYIEKQAAIDAFKPQCGDWSEAWSAEEIKQKLDAIPPADVRPVVRSRWQISYDGWYPYCPACGAEPPGREMTPFCSMCGADMREVGENG